MAGASAVLVFDGSRPGHSQWAASFLDMYQQAGGLGYPVRAVDVARLANADVRKALVATIEGRAGGDVFLCLPPDRSLLYGASLRAVVESMVATVQLRAAAEAPPSPPAERRQPLLQPTVVAARTAPSGTPLDQQPAPSGGAVPMQAPAGRHQDPRVQAAFADRPSQNDPEDYASVPHVSA